MHLPDHLHTNHQSHTQHNTKQHIRPPPNHLTPHTHHPAPLTPPPQPPQNPHLTQPLQHRQTATTSGTDMRWQAIDDGKPAQNLPACSGRLVRLQSRPRVAPRGPDGHISVTCGTQSQQFEPDHGDMAEVTCSCAVIPLSGFWWGSAPQMLLVQQPEWLSGGCKAMGPEAWTHPRGRERAMPWQLTSWAVQPARSDGGLNSKFGGSMS